MTIPPDDRSLERLPQVRLRRRHERIVFREIRAHAPISRSQLADQTGLSAQAVGRIVRAFLDEGLIEETDMAKEAGPGAPPIGLRARAEGAFAIGLGLERDRFAAVVVDLEGTVRAQQSAELPSGEAPDVTLKRFQDWITGTLSAPRWRAQRDRFCGIGIAVPGPIDRRKGTVVGPPNFPGWRHVDLVSALGPPSRLPVVVDNAATAAALGVEWRLPGQHGSFLYCYWGLGIGGGLILEDEAYRGVTGNAVELGHVVVDPFGRPCACGGVGCLEAEASVVALLNDAHAYGPCASLEELVEAARTRPELANILVRAAERMGAALLSAVNLADVNQVVVGGEHFHLVEPVFLPILRRWVEEQAFRGQVAPVRISVATLGEEANAIGAAAVAFQALVPNGGSARAGSLDSLSDAP